MPITELTPAEGADASRPPRSRRDRGYSLIEIAVTVVLIGIVATALFQSVTTSIRTSSQGRFAAQVETTVVNASDRVNRATKRCDYLSVVQNAVRQQQWPDSTASVQQEFYVPGANSGAAGSWQAGPPSAPACPAFGQEAQIIQRVTITISSPDGSIRREIEVVKSDV